MDMGAHAIDLLAFLLGDVSKVAALVNSRVGGWQVEETATVIMETKSGVNAIVDTSFVIPRGGNMLEIFGTKGTVLVSGGKLNIYINGNMEEKSYPSENLYKPQSEHFDRCINSGEALIAPGIAGLKNVQTIAAAYESAKTGRIINISEIEENS